MRGLCHRCEHRAKFYEEGHGPRCECQTPDMSVGSCYMFVPVIPPILGIAPGYENRKDLRFAGTMLRPRESIVRLPEKHEEVYLNVLEISKDELMYYWKPVRKNKKYLDKSKKV